MSDFINAPVPPLDHIPHAAGAPPGVRLHLDAYDQDWIDQRPWITPRVGVVHTNGGGGEGSYAGAIGWSNGGSSRTHAHYNLNEPTPAKNLPTNRRSIANSTPRAKELEYGVPDSSYWTISIETADRGYNNGGGIDLGDFLHNHDELLARIIAYESIVWGIPIVVPDTWVGTGWLTHTAPFDGVYTLYTGKSCPGTTKKARVLGGDILPRAQHIFNVWTGVTEPTEEEEDMKAYALWKHVDHPEVFLVGGGGVIHVDGPIRDWALAEGAKDLRNASGHNETYAKFVKLSQGYDYVKMAAALKALG